MSRVSVHAYVIVIIPMAGTAVHVIDDHSSFWKPGSPFVDGRVDAAELTPKKFPVLFRIDSQGTRVGTLTDFFQIYCLGRSQRFDFPVIAACEV